MVVKYVYDAWGNHEVFNADGSACNDGIGVLNPFRYRGYYYDVETGLYYLQTRYYDPVTGRFLNRDSVTYADPSTVHGLNLYAYCRNNPVMYTDPTGGFVLVALILGLGFVGGAIVNGINAYNSAMTEGKTGSELFWAIIKGSLVGGSFGLAVAGAFISLIAVAAGALGATTVFGGVPVLKAFALGAVAFDFTAFVVAPIVGVSMGGIEYESNPVKVPYFQKKQENTYNQANGKCYNEIFHEFLCDKL